MQRIRLSHGLGLQPGGFTGGGRLASTALDVDRVLDGSASGR
jgi:hypothetical protein